MELRKTTHVVRSLTAVLAAALTLALVAVPAEAQAAAIPPANVVSSAPPQMRAAQVSGEYWTAAKMAAAKSADAPNPTALKSSKVGTATVAAARGGRQAGDGQSDRGNPRGPGRYFGADGG